MSGPERPERPADLFDARAILADCSALAALKQLGVGLRRAGYDSTPRTALARLALGSPVPRSSLEHSLSGGCLDALSAVGAIEADEHTVCLRFRLFSAGQILIVVPTAADPREEVYLGYDSIFLLETVWRRAPGGRAAVDVGTGTGILAAVLASRYALVVGTELLPSTAACAALTVALNPPSRDGHRAAVCITDVVAALRPRSFDLVTMNPPYLPDPVPGKNGCWAIYAHGGPTGCELPRRFINEGLDLLRPGGLLVAIALDAQLIDGRQPLRALCRSLEQREFDVSILPVPPNRLRPNWTEQVVASHPILLGARLVVLLIRSR